MNNKMFFLFECYHEGRTEKTVADIIINATNANKAIRYLSDSLRKEFMKWSPKLDINGNSVSCSYTDSHDGLSYQKEFNLIVSCETEQEAERFFQTHHEKMATVVI